MKHRILEKERSRTYRPNSRHEGLKAAVITDKDLVKFEVATKVTKLLDEAGVDYALYDGIVPNPTIQMSKTA